MFRQKMLWATAALVVLGVGSFLIFRPKAHLEVVKIYTPAESVAITESKKQLAETPGSSCCPPANVSELRAEAREGSTPLAVEPSDVDPTQSHSAPLSAEKVVPDVVVQGSEQSERFREWEAKNNALRVKWKAHNTRGDEHLRDSKYQLVKMLMTLPIETRRGLIEKMKSQFPPEAWDEYESDLYSIGLDFTTEVSPEASEKRFQQMLSEITDGVQKRKEHSEATLNLLEEQRAVDTRARDF